HTNPELARVGVSEKGTHLNPRFFGHTTHLKSSNCNYFTHATFVMKLKFVKIFRIGLIAVLISILVIFLLTGVGETDVRAASAEQPQQEKPKGGEKEPVEEMRVYLCPLPGGMEAPIPVYRKRAVKYITEADIVAEIDRVDVSQQHLPNGEADRMEWTYHIKNLRKGTLPPGVTAFCLSLSPQEKQYEGRASFDGRGWLRVKHNQLSGESRQQGAIADPAGLDL
ncbi:MAG: hypothetical protein ACI4OZ_04750, partial [Akkermansia sp.]